MSRVLPSPILEAIREKALTFHTEEEELQNVIDYWTSVSELGSAQGWETLIEIVDVAINTHMQRLVEEIDPRNIASLQAHVTSLRYLKSIPAIAAAQLEATRHRMADVEARKNEYIHHG